MIRSPRSRRRRAPATLLLAVVALAASLALAASQGCGGARAPSYHETVIEPEREDPAELESEQQQLEGELSEVMARPDPDCARACELGDAICDLRQRICAIADRHPTDEATAGRCTDAAVRCDEARERIAAQCACAAP